jgi:hypothetical protein
MGSYQTSVNPSVGRIKRQKLICSELFSGLLQKVAGSRELFN